MTQITPPKSVRATEQEKTEQTTVKQDIIGLANVLRRTPLSLKDVLELKNADKFYFEALRIKDERTDNIDLSDILMPYSVVKDSKFTKLSANKTSFMQSVFNHLEIECLEAEKSNFGGASISRVKIRSGFIDESNFSGSKIIRSTFNKSYELLSAKKTDFTDAKIFESNIRAVDLSESKIKNAMIRDSDMEGSIFRGADLTDTLFENVNFCRCDFSGADITGTKFINVKFDGAILKDMIVIIGGKKLVCNGQEFI
ncbi:MAG: pentapeptide repeat-containing protein [Candidatus Micrarchaeia archaeon]